MPVPLTALFAAAIYQVKASAVDPVGTERVLGLLSRAAAGTPVTFELEDERLLVNGLPVGGDAPGALLVRTALIEHETSRIELPMGMSASQWHDVAELFASAPGLFPSAAHVREALLSAVPGSTLLEHNRPTMSPELRAALFGLSGASVAEAYSHDPSLVSRDTGRAEFSTRLDPLVHAGTRAVDQKEWETVAEIIIKLRELEQETDPASRTIVARERHRIAPGHVLDALVRLLPKPNTPPVVLRAINALGTDGASALIEALNGAPGKAERRAYIEALAAAPDAEAAIITALGSHRTTLVRDVAEAAGKRRSNRTVNALGALLRHSEHEVRTAAYRALEEIATPEALEALSRRS